MGLDITDPQVWLAVEKYVAWTCACELAAVNGLIRFH